MRKLLKALRIILAGVVTVVGIAVLTSGPSQAADNSYWLTNSNSNSSSFDCYAYMDGEWKKINDGKTKKGMTKSTPFKCDADWYATTITGAKVTGKLKKNKVYKWSSSALNQLDGFKWAVAFKW